jgi:NhaP-type Na+/H+ or K+/H+ antiporter
VKDHHGACCPSADRKNDMCPHSTVPLDVCLFLFMMCLIGQLMKQFSAFSGIPFTSLITVIGLIFGILTEKYDLGRLGKAIMVYSRLDAHLLLLIFLPALIFESAFNSYWHIFKVELAQILIMAGPMLLGSTVLSAIMMTYIFQYQEVLDKVTG